MNIAVYANVALSGNKRGVYETVRQMRRAGHAVDVYATSQAERRYLPLAELARAEYIYALPAARVWRGRLPGLRRYLDAAGALLLLRAVDATARRIAADINKRGYEYVFLRHCMPVQSPFLLRYLRVPSVYHCAEPMRTFYEAPVARPYTRPASLAVAAQRLWYAPGEALVQRTMRLADRRNIRHATLLLSNSRFTSEQIRSAYGLVARTWLEGVDAARFHPLGLARENFVLSVGMLAPHKGFDFLIEALAQLPAAQRPPLVVVSNSDSPRERGYLTQLAARYGVACELRIGVDDDELVALYNRAAAFVFAPVLEPFGLVVLEAMACATPVVAVAEGGPRESLIHEQSGLLVERQPAHFAAALARVLNDPALAQRLGHAARADVEARWTWEQSFARYEAIVGESLFQKGRVQGRVPLS